MTRHQFTPTDFEHPHPIEDFVDATLKNWLGEWLLYNPVIRSCQLRGDERVLDFGCGSGVGSRAIARRLSAGGRLTCLDTSGFWIERARRRLRRFDHVDFVQCDVRQAELPAASYDVITIFYVLHDIAPPERPAIVEALARLMRSGARLYIYEPTKPSHGMPAREIRQLMAGAGLREGSSRPQRRAYLGTYRA